MASIPQVPSDARPLPPRSHRRWWMVFLVLNAGFGLWMLWQQYHLIAAYDTQQTQIQEYGYLHGAIRYYDEVLTMSARMAVLTNDQQWFDRYQTTAPQLETVIHRVQTIYPSREVQQAIQQIDVANRLLVGQEVNAMQFARQGDAQTAQAILSSPDYRVAKDRYSAGLTTLREALTIQQQSMIEQTHDDSRGVKIGSLGYFLVLLAIGGAVIRRGIPS